MNEKVTNTAKNKAVLNKPLSFVILMLGITFGILNLQLVLGDEQHSVWMDALYGLLAFVGIFLSLFWVFDSKNTRVTDDYVEKGKRRIYWHEVTGSTSNDFSVVIMAGEKRVVVNYYAYRQPEKLIEAIRQYLSGSDSRKPE